MISFLVFLKLFGINFQKDFPYLAKLKLAKIKVPGILQAPGIDEGHGLDSLEAEPHHKVHEGSFHPDG